VFLALRPRGELFSGDQKLGAAVGVDRYTQFFGETRQALGGVVLVGIEQVNFGDFVFLDPGFEDFRVAMVARPLGESAVKDPVPFLFEVRGMVAHGRVKERQFLLVVAEMSGPGS